MTTQATFKHGAFAIILNEKNEVLLIHRTDMDIWELPGGKVEENEAPWDACVREVKEETGLDVEIATLLGLYARKDDQTMVFLFHCHKTGGNLQTSEESDAVAYVDMSALPINTSPKHRERIERFVQDQHTVQLVDQKGKSSRDLLKELGMI